MGVQLDTSLYKTTPFDMAGVVDSAMQGYKFADDMRTNLVARKAAIQKAAQEEEDAFLKHQDDLHNHMNAVKGTVARYVKSFPEEKRPEIWNTRAKKALISAGVDAAEMFDYDPAELEAWDLNSSTDNVRSRNQIAENKDLTARWNNEQNNATKLMLQQYATKNSGKAIIRGSNGNIWLQSKSDPNDHVDTGLGFDQSKAFLGQNTDGSFSIINYSPGNAPVASPAAPGNPVNEMDAASSIPQAAVPAPAMAAPPNVNVTATNVSKKKPIPQTERDHITVAVDQLTTIDNLEQEIKEALEEQANPNKSFLQEIVPATGIVPGLINKLTPAGMGPQLNNSINPKSTKLRATLGRIEALGLKDLSGKAITTAEMARSNQWMPNVSDKIDASLIIKAQNLKKWYRQKLIEGAKSFDPNKTGWAPEPLLEGFLSAGYEQDQELQLNEKRKELSTQQARLAALKATTSASAPAPADTSNLATLGKRAASHLGKVTAVPPGGFLEGDTQDGEDENGNPVVLTFTNGRWQEK